ncbi:hypothetical protein K438DRAFT_1728338 [Mycena galopus ATCC 62051]|nr:hypothetical protein K438DRAFT_1728338 [Mycena galopus ATCC 62051]
MVEASNRSQMRHIKDQVHDYVIVSPLLSSLIDTKEFQRLRYIKQLGTSYMVWPGAAHNRFEHCLGVAHLARSMVEHLRDTQPELDISPRDVDCVQIAGLCHDLGHGPWSHVWDGLVMPIILPEKPWKHEEGSKMMFRALLDNNKNISLPEKDVEFILALIDGDSSQCSSDEKSFLFDIVANKRNGLDVDKFDYIARDSYMIGEPIKFSPGRLINSTRVINNEICYDIKEVNFLDEICHTRFKLHKMIYNHKTAIAIEYMIVDALILAEPRMKIAEQVWDPKKFLYLTDDIMQRIESSEDPELAGARALFDRIRVRDLYKLVDQQVVKWEQRDAFLHYITPERIVDEARRLATEQETMIDLAELTPDSVIVNHATRHYGMKEKNPVDFVKFYSKHNPKTCTRAEDIHSSTLKPAIFAEVSLMIFTKRPEYFGLVQAGYRALLRSDFGTPTVEPPSTPTRGHSRTASVGSINENPFTAVPINYAPPTPSRKRESLKRARDGDSLDSVEDDERQPKRPT